MTKNIQINYNNGNSYEVLHPESNPSAVGTYSKDEIDNKISQKINEKFGWTKFMEKRVTSYSLDSNKEFHQIIFPSNSFAKNEDVMIEVSGEFRMTLGGGSGVMAYMLFFGDFSTNMKMAQLLTNGGANLPVVCTFNKTRYMLKLTTSETIEGFNVSSTSKSEKRSLGIGGDTPASSWRYLKSPTFNLASKYIMIPSPEIWFSGGPDFEKEDRTFKAGSCNLTFTMYKRPGLLNVVNA